MLVPDPNPEARKAILSFVEGEAPVSEAVDSLLDIVRGHNGKTIDGGKVWTSSLELYTVAYNPPTAGDTALERLVEFVAHLKQRPEMDIPTVSDNGSGMTFWATLLMASRETWNCEHEMSAAQWRNLNAFFALLWARNDIVDGSLWPIWCLRSELEESPEKEQDIKVYASQAYIHYAGDLMYKSQQVWDYNTPGDPKSGNRARAGGLLKEEMNVPHGYSKARWTFWKQRFEQIAAMDNLTDEVRQVAQKAASEMEVIETSG